MVVEESGVGVGERVAVGRVRPPTHPNGKARKIIKNKNQETR